MIEPYKQKRLKLYNEDCLKVLKTIPDNSIDLILTDPPYNIAKYSTGNIDLPNRSALNNNIANWDLEELDPQNFLHDFKRILKPTGNIFIFTSYNMIGKWHDSFDSEFDTFQFFIWHKTNPAPKIYKNGFLNSCEMIACMWNKGHTWNFTKQNEMHNFFESPICMGKERLKNPKHPAQKPIKLLEHIIKIASNEHGVVLDPFMGVASTAIAALNLNRMFAGCEMDKMYYDASITRIEQHQKNKQMHLNIDKFGNVREDSIDYKTSLEW
ncbi:MAG: site-specific DNA-methyltransferase [Epulopiscium sp.]|nr:site-specific DNA-methyltransferase [Candidatus Epulonipiscium sp.]